MFAVAGGCCRDGRMMAEMCIQDPWHPAHLSQSGVTRCLVQQWTEGQTVALCSQRGLAQSAGTAKRQTGKGRPGHQSLFSHRDGPVWSGHLCFSWPPVRVCSCSTHRGAATGTVLMWVWLRDWKISQVSAPVNTHPGGASPWERGDSSRKAAIHHRII